MLNHVLLKKILNCVAYGLAMLFSALASTGKLTGSTVGDVSHKYSLSIQPAGYAFSIWSLIYTLWGIFVVYQAINYFKKNEELIYNEIGYLFSINMVNISYQCFELLLSLWLIVFCVNSGPSEEFAQIIIICTLITATQMLLKINKAYEENTLNWIEYVILRVNFSIYFAWMCIATSLGVSICLWKWGVRDGGDNMVWTNEGWAILVLTLTIFFYVGVMIRNQDPFIGATSVWIYCAIFYNADYEWKTIKIYAICLAFFSLLATIYMLIKQRSHFFQLKKVQKQSEIDDYGRETLQ